MKYILVYLIIFYQTILSTIFKHLLGISSFCRFSPSCSQYTKQKIQKYGMIKGSYLGIKRLSHCHPFSNEFV